MGSMVEGFSEKAHSKVFSAMPKAWRFSGEMNEIASTLQNIGLPEEFHKASEEIYQRMSEHKAADSENSLEQILRSLLQVKLL